MEEVSSGAHLLEKKTLVSALPLQRKRRCATSGHLVHDMPKRNCIPACERVEGELRNAKGLIMRGRIGIRIGREPENCFHQFGRYSRYPEVNYACVKIYISREIASVSFRMSNFSS